MKPTSAQELIERTRRVYGEPQTPELPMPAGFAERAANRLAATPSKQLVLWERASYAGVAVAACLSLVVWLSGTRPKPESTANAADPWLDMPMSQSF